MKEHVFSKHLCEVFKVSNPLYIPRKPMLPCLIVSMYNHEIGGSKGQIIIHALNAKKLLKNEHFMTHTRNLIIESKIYPLY